MRLSIILAILIAMLGRVIAGPTQQSAGFLFTSHGNALHCRTPLDQDQQKHGDAQGLAQVILVDLMLSLHCDVLHNTVKLYDK
jgi:hypothetical protein